MQLTGTADTNTELDTVIVTATVRERGSKGETALTL